MRQQDRITDPTALGRLWALAGCAAEDKENGFIGAPEGAKCFSDGAYTAQAGKDTKLEFYKGGAARFVDLAAGMAFTIPAEEVTVDYTIAAYRTQYFFGDSILTASAETKNPYTDLENGWFIHINEWTIRHLVNPAYYKNQGLTLLNKDTLGFAITPVGEDGTSDGTRAYPTVKEGNTAMREGYEIFRFDIRIDDAEGIERPYYNIGIIRRAGELAFFGMFVMKSKENRAAVMDTIVMSFTQFAGTGTGKNYFAPGAAKEDPHWSEETLKYFRKFTTQSKKSWGVFSYSMPGDEESLHAGGGNYDFFYRNSVAMQKFIENEIWGGKKYDVYMTYTHLGKGALGEKDRTPHYYPVDMSIALAHGSGFDEKPTLEFSFQYTTNNNLVDEELTPMFDIMRGKYDDYFARLARDIKAYGKPVMFRLNNEMNSDWTSYSGIMTLLDPDIFTMTWRRLYDIFIANGVDNVIWVWNPIARSCPFSGWGEDLCYFPGVDYVQLLGGTSYEANNYTGDAMLQLVPFKQHYAALYEKNRPYFGEWSMIVGEFACGSGGATSGKIGRNAAAQAEWVKGMFEELNAPDPAPYVRQIKGLIWFNCNDYVGDLVSNRFRFTDAGTGAKGEDYSDLGQTWAEFRKGFAEEAKRKN